MTKDPEQGPHRSSGHYSKEGAWSFEIRGRLEEFEQRLEEEGTGRGPHWWSAVYTRPSIDWDTPPDAYAGD